MRKKIYLPLIGIGLLISTLSGCQKLHIHDLTVSFEHNEIEHWKTCPSCGEKFICDEHVINDLNDKCLVCDYVDPIVIVDSDGLMTGLTEHGKTKLTITLPDEVRIVAKDALNDSKVILLNLNKDFVGYYKGAFDKENLVINPYEEEVSWELINGIFYKHDILSEYDARIDDVLYTNLSDAFSAVEKDETTITILKDDLVVEEAQTINHIVTLEAYHNHITLNVDFNINAGGILNVPSSITLTSNVKLMLADTKEEISDHFDNVYSSGTIAFVNRDTKPENVYVEYVKSFEQEVGLGYKAVGSKQVVNSVLVLPVTHYAYGTFTFTKDFTGIKGLTYYGQAVTELYITNVVEGIDAHIPYRAFVVYTDIKINIHSIDDTHITFYRTKGIFTRLHISDGITSVNDNAFSNETTEDIFHEVKLVIKLLLCHITYIEIGDSVKTIGYQAFQEQLLVEEIVGGRGLTHIDRYAFYENLSLRVVDFSEAYNLTTFEKGVFGKCDTLVNVSLPRVGWNFGGDTYFPEELDPEAIAYYFTHPNVGDKITRNPNPGHIAYTSSTDIDSTGRYKRVSFTDNINTAYNNCANGGIISLLEGTPTDQRHFNVTNITKSISIYADASLDDVTIGEEDKDLVINNNQYLTLSNVTPLGNILLKNLSTDTELTATGGFAIRTVNNKEIPQLNIHYDIKDYQYNTPIPASANLVRHDEYTAYGLFNVTTTFKNGNLSEQLITGLSRLGNIAYGFAIANQYNDAYFKSYGELNIKEKAFTGNNSLHHIVFGRHVTEIKDSAFENCTNLTSVRFIEESNNMLISKIGKNAFKGCTKLTVFSIGMPKYNDKTLNEIDEDAFTNCPLEWFDFGLGRGRTWRVGDGKIVTYDNLINCENAAKLVRQYSNVKWVRV